MLEEIIVVALDSVLADVIFWVLEAIVMRLFKEYK